MLFKEQLVIYDEIDNDPQIFQQAVPEPIVPTGLINSMEYVNLDRRPVKNTLTNPCPVNGSKFEQKRSHEKIGLGIFKDRPVILTSTRAKSLSNG